MFVGSGFDASVMWSYLVLVPSPLRAGRRPSSFELLALLCHCVAEAVANRALRVAQPHPLYVGRLRLGGGSHLSLVFLARRQEFAHSQSCAGERRLEFGCARPQPLL